MVGYAFFVEEFADWSFCNRNNDKNQIEVALVAMGGHNENGG